MNTIISVRIKIISSKHNVMTFICTNIACVYSDMVRWSEGGVGVGGGGAGWWWGEGVGGGRVWGGG